MSLHDPSVPDDASEREDTSGDHPSYTPTRIGPYVLRETLGEGGMGVVYGAEQTEPVQREVALKVIKLGMDTKDVVARFEAERQALAVMEHPSIATVFDAGATDTGQPYFVMELVRGTPIVEYCDQNRLTIRDRVRLFVQACRGVQHAHQKGVIHRDLKPSNILVTEADGNPLVKIIDFGVAKATKQPLTDRPVATELEAVVGTPAYTSPEQAGVSGVDVDTRTDVYSLGVTLYELLAGVLPFEDAAYVGWARLATAMEREPPTPSRRFVDLGVAQIAVAERRGIDPASLKRALRGDLDWIVMKAIEKDRDLRYDTSESLATELVRHLENEPVLARPPSAGYRIGKFTRRHKAGVAFTVTLVALLVGVAVTQTIQAELIRQARDLADARRVQAEGVLDFMLGDLRQRLEPIGRLEILSDVGDQALAYFEGIPEEEFSDQELISRSQALYQIGLVRLTEGRAAEAVPALRESLRLARELSARDPGDLERLFGLSQSHFYAGLADFQAGDLAGAETQFQAYLEAAESLVEGDEANLDYRLELAYAHSNMGSLRQAQGDLEAAAEAFASTARAMEDLVQRRPGDLGLVNDLAEAHNLLAVAYRRLGRYGQALEEHNREYELKTEILEQDPTHADRRLRLATARFFIGVLQRLGGDIEGAAESQERASATLDSLIAYDSTNAEWILTAAGVRRELGLTLAVMGRREESLGALRAAITRFDELARTDSVGRDWGRVRGVAHFSLARSLLALGEPAAALSEADAARDLLFDGVGEGQDLALARDESELVLGHALFATGRGAEAREAWNRALTALGQRVEEPGGAEFRPLLTEAFVALDRVDEARRALAALRAAGYEEPYLIELATERGIVP